MTAEFHLDRVLLVGENNPYSDDPYFALYPKPERASGWRLCVEILGLSASEYLEKFDRVDLLHRPRWSAPAARAAAAQLVHPRRVLLGAKVAAAHGLPFTPFSVNACRGCYHCGYQGQRHAWDKVLVWPHPSPRCRLWTPEAIARARAQIAEFAV